MLDIEKITPPKELIDKGILCGFQLGATGSTLDTLLTVHSDGRFGIGYVPKGTRELNKHVVYTREELETLGWAISLALKILMPSSEPKHDVPSSEADK